MMIKRTIAVLVAMAFILVANFGAPTVKDNSDLYSSNSKKIKALRFKIRKEEEARERRSKRQKTRFASIEVNQILLASKSVTFIYN